MVFPYLRLDPEALARYWPRRWWLLAHITAGTVALLTGPVQLWLGISRRAMRVHRRLGVAYVASVGVGSIAAFYLAAQTDLGWMFGAGITGLGVAWVVTTTMAIAAVRRGLIEQHQDWMIRSYVVTFAFVTFRVLWILLQSAGVGTLREQLGVCSWFCWAVPLLVTEAALQGRKMAGARRPSAAALALVLLAMPASALAQARLTGADLEGLVRDESGGVLAGAVVTIVNAETDVARTIETDADGRFRALALPPGTYSIRHRSTRLRAPATGRDRAAARPVRIGSISRCSWPTVEEGITVVAETPVVDVGHTAVSTVVGQEQMQSLPINGRNFLSFTRDHAGRHDRPHAAAGRLGDVRPVVRRPARPIEQHHGRRLRQQRPDRRRRARDVQPGSRPGVPGAHELLLRGVRQGRGRRGEHRHQERHERCPRQRRSATSATKR